jgi:hypothetical protein
MTTGSASLLLLVNFIKLDLIFLLNLPLLDTMAEETC